MAQLIEAVEASKSIDVRRDKHCFEPPRREKWAVNSLSSGPNARVPVLCNPSLHHLYNLNRKSQNLEVYSHTFPSRFLFLSRQVIKWECKCKRVFQIISVRKLQRSGTLCLLSVHFSLTTYLPLINHSTSSLHPPPPPTLFSHPNPNPSLPPFLSTSYLSRKSQTDTGAHTHSRTTHKRSLVSWKINGQIAGDMSSGRYMAYSPSPSTTPHSPHLPGLRAPLSDQEK